MSTRDVAGKSVDFDDDGFMADAGAWDKDIASALAEEIGITPLTEKHWAVIDFCRTDFEAEGEAPTLRRITAQSGVTTKELYKLFPKGPAKKVAYVAGLKKPTGCL